MKKLLRIPLLLAALFLSSLPLSAYDFSVDGIYYNEINRGWGGRTAEVTKPDTYYDTSTEYLKIPEVVNSNWGYYSGIYNIIRISYDALSYYRSVKQVEIPSTISQIKISNGLFNSKSLEKIVVDLANSTYDSRDNCNAIIETASNTLIAGCKGTIIPKTVKHIGEGAFSYSGLSSVTISDSIISIGDNAFSGCELTTLTIPETLKGLGDGAFSSSTLKTVFYNAKQCQTGTRDFSGRCFSGGVDSLIIGASVQEIPRSVFRQTRIKSLIIPTSVKNIASLAFSECSKLVSITIPENVTIESSAFSDTKLITHDTPTTTFRTATIGNISTSTNYDIYYRHSQFTENYTKLNSDTITISDLDPNTDYYVHFYLKINNTYCSISSVQFKTKSINMSLNGSSGITKIVANAKISSSDKCYADSFGFSLNNTDVTRFDNSISKTFTDLDPDNEYTVHFGATNIAENTTIWVQTYAKVNDNWQYIDGKTFKTGALEWSAGEYQATSTTSVRLMTETNCDATAGTGIEWRRYGAPESLAPNKAECPVVDGMLVGYLKGLNPDAYYEYRPYYTSAAGNTYYGEWTAFFSGDAGVYFEPEVRTFTENSVDGNSVTIKGYALPGTDEVISQGFEYWKASGMSTYSTDNVKTVLASGISMSVTLSGLDYNSTYRYRAFVTTAKGTTYGDTVGFSTGYPAGIDTVEADSNDYSASYRIMPGMLVVNGDGNTPMMVADMNGRVLYSGYAAEQLELPLKAGIYILRLGNNAHKVAIR